MEILEQKENYVTICDSDTVTIHTEILFNNYPIMINYLQFYDCTRKIGALPENDINVHLQLVMNHLYIQYKTHFLRELQLKRRIKTLHIARIFSEVGTGNIEENTSFFGRTFRNRKNTYNNYNCLYVHYQIFLTFFSINLYRNQDLFDVQEHLDFT